MDDESGESTDGEALTDAGRGQSKIERLDKVGMDFLAYVSKRNQVSPKYLPIYA